MRHLGIRRTRLIVVTSLLLTLILAPMALGGIATSPMGVRPFAGLGSCPLGSVHAGFTR